MYEDKTPEQIKADIITDLNPDRDNLWDVREGSFADDQLGPMAVELSKIYFSLNEVQNIVWVDETSGSYIDLAVAVLGLEPRKQGTKAHASLRITGATGFIIPKGKYFVSTNGLNFIALEDRIIPSDEMIMIDVEAENIGSSYNVATDTIIQQFSNDAEITVVTNPEPAIGGTDPESDKSLYARLDLARKKPRTSANKFDYEEWGSEVPGVGIVRVFPCRYGRGTVMVLIADENRKPVDQAVIEACYDHISERMTCGGIELTVKTPSEITIDISADAELDGTASLDSIRSDFISAIEAYFSQISLARDVVVYTQVGAVLSSIKGIFDYSNLLLNGQSDNVSISDEHVPVLGEVTIT